MESYLRENIFIVLFISSASALSILKDAREYANTVARQMAATLERNQISSDLFLVKDFEKEINITSYGLAVVGKIKFHSGFVNSISSAHLNDQKFMSSVNESGSRIEIVFMLEGVQIAMDADYNLKNFAHSGSMLIRFQDVMFAIEIFRNHTTQVIAPEITLVSTNSGGQYKMNIQMFPSVGHTQLVAQELIHKREFRGPLEASIEAWQFPVLNALKGAVSQIDFPEIIYYSRKE